MSVGLDTCTFFSKSLRGNRRLACRTHVVSLSPVVIGEFKSVSSQASESKSRIISFASVYLRLVLSSLTTVTLSAFFTLLSDVPSVNEACPEVKQCLRVARSLARVGTKGPHLEGLGFLKRSKISPEKMPLGPSVTPVPQSLICNTGDRWASLLRCVRGDCTLCTAAITNLSLAVEALQSR